jgi:hypothetical protein
LCGWLFRRDELVCVVLEALCLVTELVGHVREFVRIVVQLGRLLKFPFGSFLIDIWHCLVLLDSGIRLIASLLAARAPQTLRPQRICHGSFEILSWLTVKTLGKCFFRPRAEDWQHGSQSGTRQADRLISYASCSLTSSGTANNLTPVSPGAIRPNCEENVVTAI